MTTIPSRIDHIRPVIEAVLNQSVKVERIEINVPYICVRTGEAYRIPDWFSDYGSLFVHRTEDWGPITKIAPTLLRHRDDEEALVWSVDDDCAYPANQLSLLASHVSPGEKRILTRHGGLVAEGGSIDFVYGVMPVDMLEGFGGVLYPTNCIDDDFEAYCRTMIENTDCRKSDDILLSFYFRKRGVEILLANQPTDDVPFMPSGFQPYATASDSLSAVDGGHLEKYKRVYAYLNEKFKPVP